LAVLMESVISDSSNRRRQDLSTNAAATAMILALAAGEIDKDGLAQWIEDKVAQASGR
jgi:hypothetical protein